MKIRNFAVGLCVSVVASLFSVGGFAVSEAGSSAESIYYPGYLSQHPYANGSFDYFLSSSVPQTAEVRIEPPSSFRAVADQETLPLSSVATFSPDQGVMSRVMLSGLSIHVGSFLENSVADGLEKRLLEKEIPSFRMSVLLNGIPYVQLHVGPFSGREETEALRSDMENTMNIPGNIVSHGLVPPP